MQALGPPLLLTSMNLAPAASSRTGNSTFCPSGMDSTAMPSCSTARSKAENASEPVHECVHTKPWRRPTPLHSPRLIPPPHLAGAAGQHGAAALHVHNAGHAAGSKGSGWPGLVAAAAAAVAAGGAGPPPSGGCERRCACPQPSGLVCTAGKAGQQGHGALPWAGVAVSALRGGADKPKPKSTDPSLLVLGSSPCGPPAVRKAPAASTGCRPRCRLHGTGFCHSRCSIDATATPTGSQLRAGRAWKHCDLGQCTGGRGASCTHCRQAAATHWCSLRPTRCP